MRLSTLLFGSLMISGALIAQQEPVPQDGPPDEPGRAVARISVLSGDASVRRSDSGDWIAAALNAPLLGGDSVSVAAGGALEVQFDNANFARVAGDSEMRISELDNGRQQIQIAKGLVTWRVLRENNAETEISTPFAAVHPGQNSSIRVEVAPDGSARIMVRHGDAEIYTQRGTERIREGNAMFIRGDSDYQMNYAAARDQWDGWNDERDSYLLRAQSPRYVSQGIYGAEDLDSYGRWDYDPTYGNVWMPTVASTWAPYRDGQWAYEPYYGWTWVDASPWGWAPFHYGSWYQRPGYGWCWFPGRRYDRVFWRPALVGFVGFGGGSGFGFGFGNIGWVPLAPYERFHPWYGRGYNFGRDNFNIVRNVNISGSYRNARFNGGVTGISTSDFERGNFRNRRPVDIGSLQQGGMVRGALPISAGSQHMRFADRAPSSNAPRADLSNRQFYSRTPSSQQASRGFVGGNNSGGYRMSPQNNVPQSSPRMTTSPGWQRFGNPQADRSQPAAAPQYNVAPGNGNNGRQFGRQPYSAPAPQPQQSEPRGFYSAPSRQVPVAPSIVQPSNPGNSRGRSFGSPDGYRGGYSAPVQQQAPAYRQQQAPVYQQQAPSYRQQQPQQSFRTEAPRSEPMRSAPAYRGESARPSPAPSMRGGGESRSASPAPAPRGNPGGGGGGGNNGNGGGHGRR